MKSALIFLQHMDITCSCIVWFHVGKSATNWGEIEGKSLCDGPALTPYKRTDTLDTSEVCIAKCCSISASYGAQIRVVQSV
jgi:hypothetical protein